MDIQENPRPYGSGYDMGAHEFSGDTVAAALITSTPPLSASAGTTYSYAITAAGIPAPTITVSGLPASWLAFDGVDALSGTPSAGDVGTTGTITVTATNSEGSDTQQFQISVAEGATQTLWVNPTSLELPSLAGGAVRSAPFIVHYGAAPGNASVWIDTLNLPEYVTIQPSAFPSRRIPRGPSSSRWIRRVCRAIRRFAATLM